MRLILGISTAYTLLLSLGLAGCSGEPPGSRLPGTRGYVLISIDTLRADHLGCYGHSRATSPFIDSLAERGALFENAFVQLPGTLPSHMSIFTGLYPAEHGVMPPTGVLPSELETLPEAFQRHGFRTAGHTEGGYMHGGYGFARGFDEFSHEARGAETDVERTLARGLDFLRSLDPKDRFFLFLHTYVVHDPYYPEETYLRQFWQGNEPHSFAPTGPNFIAFNHGELEMTEQALDYYEAAYDASIRYADDQLSIFFDRLTSLGFAEDLTVVVTSDHGEEFREHGKMVHEQIYRETLHVPLIFLHPAVDGPRRVQSVVASIDIAPTLYELARIRPKLSVSGKSLAPHLAGHEEPTSEAYAQSFDEGARTLVAGEGGTLYQFLNTGSDTPEPTWVSSTRSFDVFQGHLTLEARAFHEPRRLRAEVDGDTVLEIDLSPEEWVAFDVPLPQRAGRKRITVASATCTVPKSIGLGRDRRCLSFRLRGFPIRTLELYDLRADPFGSKDLSGERADLIRDFLPRLDVYRREPISSPRAQELDPDLEKRLRALGYLP